MFGLVVLIVMVLYLWLLVWATRQGWQWGGEKDGTGKYRWLGAVMGFLIVYLPVFWDWLPTVVANEYYCAKESGFFVYKTLDQWKEENPGGLKTLSMAHLPEQYRISNGPTFRNDQRYRLPDGTLLTARFDVRHSLMYVEYKKTDGESGVQLNERLRRAYKYEGPGLIKLSRYEYDLIDIGTNEVLAREIDFQKSTKGKIWNTLNDSAWKFWLQSDNRCNPKNFPNGGMQGYVDDFDSDCGNQNGKEIQRDGITISCPYRWR